MFFHFRVFLHSILFFIILRLVLIESVSAFFISLLFEKPIILCFIIVFFLLIITVSVFRVGGRWIMVPIPAILTISSIGLIAFIDSPIQKFIFEILVTIIYYFSLLGIYRLGSYSKDKTAKAIISASAMAAIFFFFSVVYGSYLNFVIPLWIIMLVFFCASVLICFQYFKLIDGDTERIFIYSLIMGIAMTEIAWTLSFWPFGYLTTGVIMLIFYYVLWDLMQSNFNGNLSKRRVLNNMIFFGSLAIVVLMTSRWMPVV